MNCQPLVTFAGALSLPGGGASRPSDGETATAAAARCITTNNLSSLRNQARHL